MADLMSRDNFASWRRKSWKVPWYVKFPLRTVSREPVPLDRPDLEFPLRGWNPEEVAHSGADWLAPPVEHPLLNRRPYADKRLVALLKLRFNTLSETETETP